MEPMNFRVLEVGRILERQKAIDWHVDYMYYREEYVLVFVFEGEIEYEIDGYGSFSAKKQDLVLFRPGLVRKAKGKGHAPLHFISIMFTMELDETAKRYFAEPYLIYENTGEHFRRMFFDARNTWIGKDALYSVKCRNLCSEILYHMILGRESTYGSRIPHMEQLEHARRVMQEHFREELSVESFADSADMSIAYFRRLFVKAYGISPMQYLMNLRIEHARDLLLSGEVNVTEAALLSGFDDIYYFSKVFKTKTGRTPSDLIKKGK